MKIPGKRAFQEEGTDGCERPRGQSVSGGQRSWSRVSERKVEWIAGGR